MSKMQNKRIYLSPPHMSGKELTFIQQAFESNWIAPLGPFVEDFENKISQYLDVKACTALNSGTAGIHLSLILSGISEGDFVICPSFTFSATANPILYLKAIPVFVDSEKETWNMDPSLLRDAINSCIQKNKKPKAIILVHLYGMPAKINEIKQIADEFEIPLIEDAAESLGSTYNQKHSGTFGKFGILSFNGNKIITTSGGGALISNDIVQIEKAKFLATQARDIAPHYEHSEIGYNYRLSNICAAIGSAQLELINERVTQRRNNFDFYVDQLSEITEIEFLKEPVENYSNRWLTTILFSQESMSSKIRMVLEKHNIESRPLWKPLHLQPVFKHFPSFLNGNSEFFFHHGLCLPSGSSLSNSEKAEICRLILTHFQA